MNRDRFRQFLRRIRAPLPTDDFELFGVLAELEEDAKALHSTQHTDEIKILFKKHNLRLENQKHPVGMTYFPVCLGQRAEIHSFKVTKGSAGQDLFIGFPNIEQEHAKALLSSIRAVYKYTGALQIRCSSAKWEQSSFSLAFILAVRSFYEERVIPAHFVITGVVNSNLERELVGSLEPKQKYIEETRPKAFFLALTEEKMTNRGENCLDIEEAWDTCVNPTHDYQQNYGQLVTFLRQRNWLRAYQSAVIMIERYELTEPLEKYIILGAALMGANHLVNIQDAYKYHKEMEILLDYFLKEEPEFFNEHQEEVAPFFCSQAITMLDILKPQEGLELLNKWSPFLAKSKIHYCGTKARLARACKDYDLAHRLYKENIDRSRRSNQQEHPRCLGDYAEFLRTQGDLDNASKYIHQALNAAKTYRNRDESYIKDTEKFLRFYNQRITGNGKVYIDDLPGWLKEVYQMEQATSIAQVEELFERMSDRGKRIKRAFFYRTCYRLDPSSVSLETLQDLSLEWKQLTDIEDIISRIPY